MRDAVRAHISWKGSTIQVSTTVPNYAERWNGVFSLKKRDLGCLMSLWRQVMHYDKAKRILELAIAMRLSHCGLSLRDIQDRYQVSRRTAERMRDAVWDIFPLEERKGFSENVKRWKINKSNIDLFLAEHNQGSFKVPSRYRGF